MSIGPLLGVLALATLPASRAAAAPATLHEFAIQGVARNADDALIPAGNVAVRIYADSLGLTPLYDSGTEFNGAIGKGIFDVIAGHGAPLALDCEQSYFLELDVAGAEVIGDAAGGRLRFFPGGGSHSRSDLEARLSLLEAAVSGPEFAPAARSGAPPRASANAARTAGANAVRPLGAPLHATATFANLHGLLGFGPAAGTHGGYTVSANLLPAPVGVRTSGSVEAQLGPYYLFTPTPNPIVRFVHDVPGDQGRAVRLRWRKDQRERASSPSDTLPNVTSYTVYRRIDAGEATAARAHPAGTGAPSARQLALPPGDWDVLTTIPATLDSTYQTVMATLCDSTPAGICWSALMVRAITDRVGVYYNSAVDSGYSVDNLAPSVPAGLAAQPVPGGTQLTWQASTAPDFQYFRVYRGSDLDFTPGPTNLVQATTGTNWLDPAPGHFVYKLTALDFNGNESGAAAVSLVTGVEARMPSSLAFAAMQPNPFTHALTLMIDVPERCGAVDLAVFDITGRRVRSLSSGALPAGRHTFTWDGRSQDGSRAAPGVYVARLAGAGRVLTRRATLLP